MTHRSDTFLKFILVLLLDSLHNVEILLSMGFYYPLRIIQMIRQYICAYTHTFSLFRWSSSKPIAFFKLNPFRRPACPEGLRMALSSLRSFDFCSPINRSNTCQYWKSVFQMNTYRFPSVYFRFPSVYFCIPLVNVPVHPEVPPSCF